jgi:serralysin
LVDIPGNSTTTATVTVGSTTSSTLETFGDHDWFAITLSAGQSITVTVNGITLEDPYLYVRDSAGNLLYENDDINLGVNRNSQLSFTATYSGTYYIDVGAWDEGYTGDYQVVVNPYTPPPVATVQQIADQLVEGYWGGNSQHFNVTQGGSLTVDITALTSAGQTLALAALAEWTEIIGVTFVQVASGAQITFDDNEPGAFSDFITSGGIITSSTVNVSTQWLAQNGTGTNSYSFQTYIHEIGHALGLGHAGNYNGEASYPDDALFQNDAWATSVMSYFSQTENTYFAGQGFDQNFILTPMMADIYAMSLLYGLSTTTRSGNSTYTFGGPGSGAQCIYDAGGIDWIQADGYSGPQLINLNPGTFSNIGGDAGNVSIALGVIIENAMGGTGNDTLVGNADNNQLLGQNGDDILDGGLGADILTGGNGNDAYVVDQVGDVVVESAGQGNDLVVARASYTLAAGVSIETMNTVNGSATTAINLTGNELGQSIYGNAGDNILTGMGGSDYLVGGLGNDRFFVDESDFISELLGQGDDWIFVPGTYILREGNEIETLAAANQASLDAVNLTGNEYGQSLYGSEGVNSMHGGAGNDYLVGLGSNDFLIGGGGSDNLAGGAGNDIYYVDTGDWVIEAAGQGDDRVVAFDHFALRLGESVETLVAAEGSAAIVLTGNALAQSIYGNDGNNVLTGLGGADYLVGGGGNDLFVLSSGSVATVGDYATGEVVDITQILSVAGGTNVVAGGYLKVTSGGQLQVDTNGGGDAWVSLANLSGSSAVTVRYLSGGTPTDLSVARSGQEEFASKSTAASAEDIGHAPGGDAFDPAPLLHADPFDALVAQQDWALV